LFTRVRAVAGVAALVAIAGSSLWAPAASAADPTPTVKVTPETDLVNGSTVTVTGTGYTPGEFVVIHECVIGQCNPFVIAQASSTGTITYVGFPISTTVGTASCATQDCFVVTLRPPYTAAFSAATLIWFRNASGDTLSHSITVSPSAGLVDGQPVTVSGTDFDNGDTAVNECIVEPVVACAPVFTATFADINGNFTTTYVVRREFDAVILTPEAGGSTGIPYHVKCTDPVSAPSGCVLTGTQGYTFGPGWIVSVAPISFRATTSADCMKGGWQGVVDDHGTPFKNQGDCQSFIATGGKNKAAG